MAFHNHRHPRVSSGRERLALRRALLVTSFLFVAEVVGGLIANSLALLSDAGHMLTDLLALGLSAAAIGFATIPATDRRTFGYYRLEILSALANGVLLAVLAGGILVEAWGRFGSPSPVRIAILAPIAAGGLLANLLSFWWLSRARGGLATRAALWHTAADTASSLLVLVAALIMLVTGWWWIDSLVSVTLAGVMVFGALRLLREALDVLLESTPREVNLSEVDSAMRGVEGVEGIHDLHVWSLTSGVHALSGHLSVQPERLAQTDRIINEARQLLKSDFRITHTTLQVESEACGEVVCVLGPSELTDGTEDRSAAGGQGDKDE